MVLSLDHQEILRRLSRLEIDLAKLLKMDMDFQEDLQVLHDEVDSEIQKIRIKNGY
jgi:peptidyl-tRNA hydrolase